MEKRTDDHNDHDNPSPFHRTHKAKLIAILFITMLGLAWYRMPLSTNLPPTLYHPHALQPADSLLPNAEPAAVPMIPSADTKKRVPLEIHIMSKCPDARDCMQQLVVPAMVNISSKVDFKLSFIGRATSHDDDVACMHGPGECLGNIVELCAASLYPDPKIYLGFAMCLEAQYGKIPGEEFVRDCAAEHGVDFGKVNECMSRDDGAWGMGMLRESVEGTRQAGVTKSCTVRLGGEVRCIRDGGVWKDCEGGSEVKDLVGDVERLYRGIEQVE
ncbi:hypothetical protein LTS18_003620 [Coniosporium uncinatum]|uniref:Uncharacterized protein n=1 Tax=Coniosporium uncinatum TaxID=93489 RepID=A0ACC3D6F9_9PEZI|nr:hypothetical protein LTS18_003620 [Coniosporium uncinatum]